MGVHSILGIDILLIALIVVIVGGMGSVQGALSGGIVIGLMLALFVISKQRTLRAPARAYINFFRGTPLIWQLSFAGLGVATNLGGYLVLLDRNEITLLKSSVAAGHLSHAFFFWDQVTLPPINLTLSAAFTEVDAGLSIRIRVLSTPQQTVLWEANVVDTPGLDAVLPNRAVKGILMEPEGIPAPYLGVDLLPHVGVWYGDPYAAPSGAVHTRRRTEAGLDHGTNLHRAGSLRAGPVRNRKPARTTAEDPGGGLALVPASTPFDREVTSKSPVGVNLNDSSS